MNVTKNVPELRFKEFNGEWEEYPLHEILEISNKKFNPETNLTNQICIELEHISSETGELLGFINSNNQKSIKNIFKKNQIIYGKLRPYLKKYWFAKFDGVCSSEFWVLNGKEIENKYLYFFIQTEKFNQIANVSSGSKMPRADWNYMSLFEVFIPHYIPEQQKIASFLTAVDKKIEIVAKKIKHLESYKKGLMQKLLTGEIRFPGFYDEWKEEKLGKLKNIINFKRGESITKFNVIFGDIPVIAGGKEPAYFHNIFNRTGETITISSSGANAGYVNFFNSPIFVSDCFTIISKQKNINIKFLFYILKRTQKQIYTLQSGGAQPHIYPKDIENLIIYYPSIEEQQKIASFLTAVDKKIELNKNKLENLKTYKKGLLQKMFV